MIHICPICRKGKAVHFGKNVYRCLHNPACGKLFNATLNGDHLEVVKASEVPPPKPKLHEIKCVECGKMRTVHPQDLFQVKRCVECQAAYRSIRHRRIRDERITTGSQ